MNEMSSAKEISFAVLEHGRTVSHVTKMLHKPVRGAVRMGEIVHTIKPQEDVVYSPVWRAADHVVLIDDED